MKLQEYTEMVKKLIESNRNLILYALVGCLGVLVDMTVFYILFSIMRIPVFVSNFVSISAGITNNFFLNAFFNFKTKDNLLVRYMRFSGIGLFGYLISTILIYILSDIFFIDEMIAKFFTLFLVFLVQYNLNKRFSFGK